MNKIETSLTQTVQKGGCAAKVSATELRTILSQVHFPKPHPELLVDGRFFDDAGVYKINDSIAMVQTLDFFTPILDSPRHFGAVAAAKLRRYQPMAEKDIVSKQDFDVVVAAEKSAD